MFVYVIVNSDTLKIYVGKTKNPNLKQYLRQKVWSAQTGRYKGCSYLFASMQKYPSRVWSIHPLLQSDSHTEICEHEKLLIKALSSRNPEIGYNICRGGEGFTGPHTPETIAKINEARKKRWSDPLVRAKELEGFDKGRNDPEVHIKQAASMRRRWLNLESRAKQATTVKRAWSDPELLLRQSEIVKNLWSSPGTRYKMLEGAKKRCGQKNSEAVKKAWANPEIRIKYIKAAKKRFNDPMVCAKLSASNGKAWTNPEIRAKYVEAAKNRWIRGENNRLPSEEQRAKGRHTRWHAVRGVVGDGCRFCLEGLLKAE